MAILRSKEIWDMEVDEIQDKLVELRAELSKNVSNCLLYTSPSPRD